MPQGSRQYHRKSRNSCGQCKKRRVRCDLQPPICFNCKRRGDACDYLLTVQQSQTRSLIGRPQYALAVRPFSYHYDLQAEALEYFTLAPFANPHDVLQGPRPWADTLPWLLDKTWLQPGVSGPEASLWRKELLKQSQQFSYLEPSASSLWALYHSYQEKTVSGKLRENAIQFNIKASYLFRDSKPNVNGDNWLAVLVFGISVIIFHFATVHSSPQTEDSFVTIFKLLRETASVSIAVGPYFKHSQLKTFIDQRQSLFKANLESHVWEAIQKLDEVEFPITTPETTKHTCRHAIASLKSWVKQIDGRPRSWLHFMLYPSAVQEDFVDLLIARHPVALLIFVHWCAIMYRGPRRWYMADWARRDATLAMSTLDGTWNDFLKWPRTQLASVSSPQTLPPISSSSSSQSSSLESFEWMQLNEPLD